MGDVDNLDLIQTPLDGLHRELGARMVPFAGYSMPVSYPLGVMKEHQHTRAAAGLFDLSHMGQVRLTARSGNVNDAALALERLVPVSVAGLAEGRQRYGLFTNDAGGIIDDLMIARRADHLYLVINASRKAVDLAHMADHLGADWYCRRSIRPCPDRPSGACSRFIAGASRAARSGYGLYGCLRL